MRFLIVGLGSMGKRRIRNLQALGVEHIAGVDPREDRRTEASHKYGIAAHEDFELALQEFQPDASVISTPPRDHVPYIQRGVDCGLHCFVEASVVNAEELLALHRKAADRRLVIAPSCTMRYYPGPRKVKELIGAGAIGKPLNINYQTGQYLPDWHPWENIGDFYVSARDTGGCREIVPFELTWLNDIFGAPEPLACVKTKLTDMDADIDDIYHCLLRYPGDVLANITVEVISRPCPTRELRVIGSTGQIVFSHDENCVRHIDTDMPTWKRHDLSKGTVEAGYINPEEPYIAEMRDFIDAMTLGDNAPFPNTLLEDYRVLQTLYQLEKLAEAAK